MWHGLTAGEPDENVEIIFSDIVAWLNVRSRSWTLEDRLRKLMPTPGKFIDSEKNGAGSEAPAPVRGRPRPRRGGFLCGLAGRTHHHAEM
uniref:Uncharacterized protein n=1 Tax=Arundo donax TaxID=35708 RepID=A0A0A9FJZ2_ARUDO